MLSRSSAAVSRAAATRLPPATTAAAAYVQRSTAASASAGPSTSSGSRFISSSRSALLPRQIGRTSYANNTGTSSTHSAGQATKHQEQGGHHHQPQQPSSSSSSSSFAPAADDVNIPWFMEAEHVDPPQYSAESDLASPDGGSAKGLTTSDNAAETVEARRSAHFEFLPESAAADIPTAILNLQHHLLTGPASNLIARPPSSRDDDLPASISLIHPYSLSADPSNDAYGKTDYIVVVQVKSSAAGSVRKVAQDVGNFLERQTPPPVEGQPAIGLDDLLGPEPAKERYQRSSSSSSSSAADEIAAEDASASSADAFSARPPRPKGMSRIEHELGKKLPDWAVHRIALSRKFPDGWKPPKILSREAQDGLRLLHGSDPERFDVEELAARFRISSESVRRILKGGKWNVPSETRARQDQKAKERIASSIYSRPERWSREENEIAEIRRLQEDGSELVEDGEDEGEFDGEDAFYAEDAASAEHQIYPVRYEGLVTAASEASATGSTAKGPSKNSHKSRGDGHWCLVDADWCMVHVMTEQARYRYDIEGMWRELEADNAAAARLYQPKDHAAVADEATSTARSRRSIFGQNLKAHHNPARPKGDFRFFSTSCRAAAAGVGSGSGVGGAAYDLPESLNQLLTRCGQTLAASDEAAAEGIPVVAQGWLRSSRKQKSVTFLEMTDGTLAGGRTLQAVVRHGSGAAASSPASETDLSGLTTGAALRLEGLLKRGRGSKKGQEVELDVKSLRVVGGCDATYPLAVQQQQQQQQGVKSKASRIEEGESGTAQAGSGFQASLAERRSPHLRGRLPRHGAVLRTRQRLESGMAEWFELHDFTKVTCPILTSSDCEGAGEVFQVVADSDVRWLLSPSPTTAPSGTTLQQTLSSFWSGSPTYLTVSSQLHLEAIGLGLSRVWTINPAFRAEGSATNRHLSEFWMVEAEMYWTDDGSRQDSNDIALARVMDSCEGAIKSAIRRALSAHEDMEILLPINNNSNNNNNNNDDVTASTEGHLEMLKRIVSTSRWKRITYDEAIKILRDHHDKTREGGGGFTFEPIWREGLASEHERYLSSPSVFDGPVFVTDFPKNVKAFYMRSNAAAQTQGGATVACFDLIIPKVGELVGGSVREERHEVLQERIKQEGGAGASLKWYTDDLRRYGGTSHGGWGLGMERMLAWITGTENVRDVNTFERRKGIVRF